jgi:8-oxo-dGTP pyrophosphatase MutT (NUDIX family)
VIIGLGDWNMDLKTLVNYYIKIYPNEVNDLRLLLDQLIQPEDITSRKNFIGHVTASAYIINNHTKQVLLLEHKILNKLLQPGGHIDSSSESPSMAAQREVAEETGIKPTALSIRPIISQESFVPFDINTHFIPENPKKGEPSHYHHDFRYLYVTDSNNVKIDYGESNGYRWVDWDQFTNNPDFTLVSKKISSLLK